MSERLIIRLIGVVIGLAGFLMVANESWLLSLGLFLAMWGNNITLQDRRK